MIESLCNDCPCKCDKSNWPIKIEKCDRRERAETNEK